MKLLRLLPFPTVLFLAAFLRPDIAELRDFPEYWAAANVFARHGDPYDGAALKPLQAEYVGPASRLPVEQKAEQPPETAGKVVSLWTPPWTLPLYLPVGFLPPLVAGYVWLAAQLLVLFAAVEMLWRTYRGPPALWWLPHLLACLFAPVFWTVVFGQNTPLLLLGLAGFIRFRDTRPLVAGLFLALAAVKPHLFAAVGVAVLLDVLRPGGWKVLAGAVGAVAVASLAAVAWNPHIFPQFISAINRPTTDETIPPSKWMLPLLSNVLRRVFDPACEKGSFWIQFVPCAVTALAVVPYWVARRRAWDWAVEMPRLVLASALSAPYGGWMFDLVVLLVPVVHAAAVLAGAKRLYAGVAAVLYVLLAHGGLTIPSLAAAVWFTPAVAAVCGVGLVLSSVSRDRRGALPVALPFGSRLTDDRAVE